MSAESAPQWSSRLGFILAASGSAIGLGNIVFFSANAYRFGAGAFYVPYLVALAVVGFPVLVLELGLGGLTRSSFPGALRRVAGPVGEALGWFALGSGAAITMYYITILGWVLGMWVMAFGDELWSPSVALPAFGLASGAVPNPVASFFAMLSSWSNVGFVALIWALNVVIVWFGTKGIEKAVQVFVPAMWLFMLVMIVRGITLPGGLHGVYLLFTPELEAMRDPEVWRGAFSQMFFTLSLGFGVMTTYASYLPKKSDQTASGLTIAAMNCSFELIAGFAIFSMLFAFALVPKASTLAMMFFIVPQGIAAFPAGVKLFGVLFFTLLLFAGLSSSVSLVEAFAGALVEKFGRSGVSRGRALVAVSAVGMVGSLAFAWPTVIDKGLDGDGTVGLTLLDLVDHWAFSYGLLLAGLAECVLVGWVLGPEKLREFLNAHGRIKIGRWFDVVIKYVLPLLIGALLLLGAWGELRDGLYGSAVAGAGRSWAVGVLLAWLLGSAGLSMLLTNTGAFPARTVQEDLEEARS